MAARKKSGAVLCSNCRQLIGVKEKACPYCGAVAPGLFGFAPGLQALFRDHLDPTTVLTGFCIFMYGLSLVIDPHCIHLGVDLDFGSPSSAALRTLGMTGGFAMSDGHLWTLLTAGFLHGSLIHIGFNLMWLRSLGPTAQEIFGPGRLVLLYVLSSVGCFLLSNLWSGSPTIGASGAIFGLMGALLAFGKRRGGTFGASIRRNMLMWAGILFFLGLAMPGVNNAGHVGGFVTGLALGWLLPYKDRKRESRRSQLGAIVLLLATIGSFAASIISTHGSFASGQCF